MGRPVRTVVVVGAGLAGSRTAETLRAEGFDGRVIVVGEEPELPYERPALSKEFLVGKRDRESLRLRPAGFHEQRRIELVLGERVEEIDAAARVALTSRGRSLQWDALVLATGARARRLPFPQLPAGVHTLRTLADAEVLRDELAPGRRLVVVGGGFIGAEVASSARSLGVEVAMIELAAVPLERVLGAEVGALLARRYREQGVDLRLGTGIAGFRAGSDGRVRAALVADGSEIACDLAVVGIGAEPAGELLGGGAVETDAAGRTRLPDVYACGDVASAWRPSLGGLVRVEHWTSASGQAAAVARTILGQAAGHDDVPFFWSDQFGMRLQHVGHATSWARVELEGEGDAFTARYLAADGRLLAALAVNRPTSVAGLRHELRRAA
jgi:3-phenylpropionate/trans-cinnamate dioxygenase ferredoxin reductase subunit